MDTSRVSARQPRPFLLLVQKKVPKEKDTPHHVPSGFLALLDKAGGCATRPNRPQNAACRGAQTVLAENSCLACAAQRGAKGKGPALAAIIPDPDTTRHSAKAGMQHQSNNY
jgi:hypothetical protein